MRPYHTTTTEEILTMAKFTPKTFKSGTFDLNSYSSDNGDTAFRWTLAFANGNKRVSAKLYKDEDQAKCAINKYIHICKERAKTERIWAFYNVIAADGTKRDIFLDRTTADLSDFV